MDTEVVAKQLLGKLLVREIENKRIAGMIVETEAYLGQKDLGCHASKGKTERNKSMFLIGGTAYVYFIYGMYYLFNVVTRSIDEPEAVLIRALEPVEGIDEMIINRNNQSKIISLTNGPGKLTKALIINKSLNGHDLLHSPLYLEDYKSIDICDIHTSTRIGIDYAKEWKDKMLRYYIKNNKHISKK